MLTLNTKLAREIVSIEKLEKKIIARTAKLKALINQPKYLNSPRPIIQTPVIKTMRPSWGPGRSVPQNVKDEIGNYLKERFTGEEISKHFNVSLPTIQKIKKQMGLVKERNMFGMAAK